MPKEGYDVLRLIEHNQVCYVSSEYVKGETLVKWLQYHSQIPKDVLFSFMRTMTKQLAQFHKCRGKPCYQYVNPYSVIVTEEKELYFLDMSADSNEQELRKMQKRVVREYFLPADEAYYQTASVPLDIYGLGRTFQYLLAESECVPQLRKSEIAKLQKMISRCLNRHSKRAFQKVSDIQKYIPEYKPSKERTGNTKKVIIFIAVFLALVMGTAVFLQRIGKFHEMKERKSQEALTDEKDGAKTKGNIEERTEDDLEDKYKMELGVLHFLELQDYEKSREYFESVGDNALAENMAVIAACMSGERVQEEKLRGALMAAKTEIEQLKESELSYYPCLIRGYARLETEEDGGMLIELGEQYLSLDGADDVRRREVTGYMAMAYEKTKQPEKALALFEQMILEEEGKAKEELYKKMAALHMDVGNADQSQEILRQGITEFPQSAELRMQYIRVQCQDAGVDREICCQTVEETLKVLPDLENDTEFQKLLKESGFAAEGGNVWVKE